MKRLLMMCALAGLVIACGDDDGDKTPPADGGAKDGGSMDSGAKDGSVAPDTGTPTANKVTNVGAMCTVANQATACMGAMPICQEKGLGGVTVPGGSCSAVCSTDAECGPGGVCPTGAAIKMFGDRATMTLGTTGYCNKGCTKGSGSTTCGAGFTCTSLYEISLAQGMATVDIAPLNQYFCFPATTPPTDGGVRDGGAPITLDGGLDAGR